MTDHLQQKSIESVRELLRSALAEKELRVREAKAALEQAKFNLQIADQALEAFELSISSTLSPPEYSPDEEKEKLTERRRMLYSQGRGRTEFVIQGIQSFGGQPFTPQQLLEKLESIDSDITGALTPHVADVTRVLTRLLSSRTYPVERCEKGAGRKSPKYRQSPPTPV
jgi:hypothetical protein